MSDLARLTATEARAGFKLGRFGSEDLLRACLARLDAREAEVLAWTHVEAEAALEQAKAADRDGQPGALGGIPIGIKDVFLTKDMPTEFNSPIYKGMQPGIDAAAVSLLRQAGAIVLGKTTTVEFASLGRKAPTRNPHDLSRTPGASSSGSAAAVADFHVPFALGTQTGGSMIRPASFCGTWAMKPSWGAVSNEGARRFAHTLDTVGWFARSCADLALIYQVLTGEDAFAKPETSGAIAALRTPYWHHAEPATHNLFGKTVQDLRLQGRDVVEVELPSDLADLAALQRKIMYGEGRAAFLPEYRMAPELLDPAIADLVTGNVGISQAALIEAQDCAAQARRIFDRFAAPFDAVIAPSTVSVAPVGLANTGDLIFNGIWTLLQVPCLNLPFTDPASGLPLGLSLLSGRGRDAQLLSVAAALELSTR